MASNGTLQLTQKKRTNQYYNFPRAGFIPDHLPGRMTNTWLKRQAAP
jgi:hypothetical protein